MDRHALAPTLRGYRGSWLGRDVVAGLVLSSLLVPQGMAYAELAGLPAVTGLYTSILCLIGYALAGPSRILVLGPDSALGPMIAAVIIPLVAADGDPAQAILIASALAVATGAIMIAAGAGNLGFVADLLSKPTILGYMNGLALTILVGQLPKLLGFSIDADNFLGEVKGVVTGIADGEVVPASAAIGLFSLLLILVLMRLLPKVPAVLVAVVVAIGLSIALDLGARGVKLIGELPQGLPSFTIPAVGIGDALAILAGALGVALVALGRHDLGLHLVRRAARAARRRQPGDDRDRGVEHRRGPVPGLPGEHEQLADRGGRERRVAHAGDRPRRGAGDRADARRPARAVRRPPPADPGRGRDRRFGHAGRHPRVRAAVPAAAD